MASATLVTRNFLSIVLCAAFLIISGCGNEANEVNQKQVEQNQAQIEQMQQQIESMRAQNASAAPAAAPGTPGSCDRGVMDTATRRGGDAFAGGNLPRALGYYQDALTACPGNPKAELNLARTYESMGNRSAAVAHYRTAAKATGADADASQQARVALSRLGVGD